MSKVSHLHEHKDEELLHLARQGDHLAFQEMVKRYEQVVATTVYGMLGKTVEADDVGQEVFIRFYRALEQFRGDASLKTYLSRIAINLSLNELKRRKRRQKWLGWWDGMQEKPEIPEERIEREDVDTKEYVNMALQQLEPDFRAVVVLRLIEGYSIKETAKMLQIKEGTVRSRLTRGQKKLRGILGDIQSI